MNHEIYLVSNEDGVLMDYLRSLNEKEYQSLIDSSTYMDYYVCACKIGNYFIIYIKDGYKAGLFPLVIVWL